MGRRQNILPFSQPFLSVAYPRWIYYPRSVEPADWVNPVAETFRDVRATIGTSEKEKKDENLKSDDVLAQLRPGLQKLGFQVEGGEQTTLDRPVHFGEQGEPDRAYKIDSFHPDWQVGIEVEAGRAWKGYNIYRDIVQSSLMVGMRYLSVAVPQRYLYGDSPTTVPAYDRCKSVFDAIYSSERFELPMDGVLLIGY